MRLLLFSLQAVARADVLEIVILGYTVILQLKTKYFCKIKIVFRIILQIVNKVLDFIFII